MEENTEKNVSSDSLDTLEEQDTAVTATPGSADAQQPNKPPKKPKEKFSFGRILSKLSSRLNIYLLLFVLLAVISLIIVFIVINSSNKEAAQQADIQTQELTQEAIDSLSNNEVTVGDPKQLLSIESNAVFAGQVLIRDGLDVAGPIKVGGDLSLPGITVSGQSNFDEVQLNTLAVSGDTNVLGTLTVSNGLTVNGTAAFGGPLSAPALTIDELSLTGDLQFARHIDAGGGTPSVVRGGSVGSGGTVTISGTDTAGTVAVNMGSGASSGTLATVSFTNAFNNSPHVVITPVTTNSGLANVNYYISSRTTTGFTISAASSPPSGSVSFDFIVID